MNSMKSVFFEFLQALILSWICFEFVMEVNTLQNVRDSSPCFQLLCNVWLKPLHTDSVVIDVC